jgi:hypothetical protein
MTGIKIGDRVRVKDKAGWPSSPGFVLANAEGTVIKWVEYDEVMEEFQDFALVRLDKVQGAGKVYVGNKMYLRVEDLEKI